MQKDINLKKLLLDRSLLVIVAVAFAIFSWFFFNLADKYIYFLFIFAFLWGWLDDRNVIKKLREENSEKSQTIKLLRLENSTLKKTASIKKHLANYKD